MKKILFATIVLLILFSGCTAKPDKNAVEKYLKNQPVIQEFLEKNPDAETRISFLKQQDIENRLDEIKKNCPRIEIRPYWFVEVAGKKEKLKLLLEENSLNMDCNYTVANTAAKRIECTTKIECDDKKSCTANDCINSKCVHTAITQCGNSDSCCPKNCVFSNDSDCPANSICGNGIIDAREQCDGSNLNNQTCISHGYSGGAVKCDSNCSLDKSDCTKCGNGIIENGENCGNCPTDVKCQGNQTCSNGTCVNSNCIPNCVGKVCGNNGCGGNCGSCPSGQNCNSTGQCTTTCTPNCTGKQCGDNGCGGNCGTCPSGQNCDNGTCKNSQSLCGNNSCEIGETIQSCQSDCTANFDKPFGVFGIDSSYPELNVNFSRIGIEWSEVEPTKGNYAWASADAKIAAIGNLDAIVTLRSISGWGTTCASAQFDKTKTSCKPNDVQAAKEFIKQTIQRYKDKIKYWQIDNEVYMAPGFFWGSTIDDYINLIKIAYPIIKDADSDAKIVAAGLNLYSIDFTSNLDPNTVASPYNNALLNIEKFLENSGNYFDVFDIHSYYDYRDIPDRINYYRAKMNSLGYDKPIIVTETNVEKENAGNSAVSASEIVKRYSVAFSTNAKKVFYYAIHDPKDPTHPRFATWGLTTFSGEKKPQYYTYKLMAEKLKGFLKVEKISEGQFKYSFENGKKVFVLWSDIGNQTINLSSQISTNNLLATHIITQSNQTTPTTETMASNAIQVTSEPIFVENETAQFSTVGQAYSLLNKKGENVLLSIGILFAIAIAILFLSRNNFNKKN